MIKDPPLISIITVTYNAINSLESTFESVFNQTYSAIEYIVIDGNSQDGTVDLIKKYSPKISYWISEPDKGLYDAMNKGLRKASGDYVWFMNAGDRIYSPKTLENIVTDNVPDIIYGDTILVDEEGKELGLRRLRPPKILTWKSFRKGMLVCHQSILVKRTITNEYNLKYRMVADIDWVINALKQAKVIKNSNEILCRFLEGGLSKENEHKSWFERYHVMVKHYGYLQTWAFHAWIILRRLISK